jgi:hypothetical protein
MTKIVYNSCYGGFSLSKKAIQRYSDLAGLGLVFKEDGMWPYWADSNGDHWSCREISRSDPFLVQVVEELGEEADGDCARLVIGKLPAGTLYRIDEYDGSESVITQDDNQWIVA